MANNKKKSSILNQKNNQHKRIIKKFELMVPLNPKKILIWLVIGFLIISFIFSLKGPIPEGEKKLPEVLSDIKEEKIEKIEVEGDSLYVYYKDDGGLFLARKESQISFTEILKDADIDATSLDFKVKDQSMTRAWAGILELVLPIVLTAIIFLWIFRQMRGAQDSIFSFGKSKARLFAKGKQNVTFKDVDGVDDAKKELEEIIDFLKHPKKYQALGARTPKGVLLLGPSGCGKTLLAKAVAGEANVPFFSMAGSEFMEMLVGVGASRTRDLFSTAKKAAPSIIFIDEIDAIGRVRGLGVAGGHDEREQTLNQILVEMDGFTPNDHVVVVAASITGETPVLIKKDEEIDLIPIGALADSYFKNDNQEGEQEVANLECLGFEQKRTFDNFTKNNLYFNHSSFKKVSSVFRHKVKEIYEVEYLGGKIRTTGNHSVFVRSAQGIKTKAVADLKVGDILVDLPFKVNRSNKKKMRVCAHDFKNHSLPTLPFFEPQMQQEWQQKFLYACQQRGTISQAKLGDELGVSQTTVGLWQRGIHYPRPISENYFKHHFPATIKLTPEFCRLLGYYVAEGYARKEVDFCFSLSESELVEDLIRIVKKTFGMETDAIRHITPGAVNVIYYAAPLAKFLIRLCGKGAAGKHIPSFLFQVPKEYFLEFLRGVWRGDGYEDKRGRGEITSVSKKLILQLNWLCRMHGMKTYVNGFVAKEGRQIKEGKPLKATMAYRLGWGKANNPFNKHTLLKTYPVKRAIVKKITKLPFDGFVYDLCGVENEAFFGGESPTLLHNTNRPELLDTALIRPGRFDRRIVVDMPDFDGRKAILKIHAKGKPFDKKVDWDNVAKRTVGFSGADLENMLNEAAIEAARKGKKAIDMDNIEEAATKVKLGPEKKRLQTDLDRKMTAYHEAGHAVVTYNLPGMDKVHRVSIVSRGLALGYTLIPPRKDRLHETKSHLLQTITLALGGRAAEETEFQEFTTGASSDINQATQIARKMVIEYGMSPLGPVNLGPQIDVTEWGRSFYEPAQVSPDMAAKVDKEVKKIVDDCYQKAVLILKKNKKKLDEVAAELIEQETIEGEEFEKVMGKKIKFLISN